MILSSIVPRCDVDAGQGAKVAPTRSAADSGHFATGSGQTTASAVTNCKNVPCDSVLVLDGDVEGFEANMTHAPTKLAQRGAAIVTGAAGGMGAAVARQLAAGRERLVLCDLHPEPLQALANALSDRSDVHVVS